MEAEIDMSEVQAKLKARTSKFVAQYAKETDRAAVILCAAKMDALLAVAVRQRLLPNPNSTDELLDSDRALGTFSARINAAFRLGIIDADLSRSLHLFRKIRNAFAHEISTSQLSEPPHCDRNNELVRAIRQTAVYESLRSAFGNLSIPDIKADFLTGTCIIILALEVATEVVQPVDTNHVIPLNLDPPAT